MNKSESKVDIAISFLSQDEKLARELFDVLHTRLDVFYYAERQDELVGKDGEEEFGIVFRDRARMVVVLYREGWGETTMTRAEKSAIKQRASKDGYSFSIWVPLDEKKMIPSYIDPQFIWFDIDRWGINGLASLIEKKVQESGIKIAPETVFDRLKKIQEENLLNDRRKEFERSEEGVDFVRKVFNELSELVKKELKKFEFLDFKPHPDIKNNSIYIQLYDHSLNLEVDRYAENSISGASLNFVVQQASKNRDGNWGRIIEDSFIPTLNDNHEPKWFHKNKYYSIDQAIEFILSEFIERGYKSLVESRK